MLRRLANALSNLDLRSFSIELLVVVLGVFIALQVNNWNDQRKALIEAEGYRARLASDFVLIQADVKSLEQTFNKRIEAAAQLRTVIQMPLSDDTLARGNDLLNDLIYVGVPIARSATFIEMLEGSKLDLLDESLTSTLIGCDTFIQTGQMNARARADQVRGLSEPLFQFALDTMHLPLTEAFELAVTDELKLLRALVLSGLADSAGLNETKRIRNCSNSVVEQLSGG